MMSLNRSIQASRTQQTRPGDSWIEYKVDTSLRLLIAKEMQILRTRMDRLLTTPEANIAIRSPVPRVLSRWCWPSASEWRHKLYNSMPLGDTVGKVVLAGCWILQDQDEPEPGL